ncbi:MAG: bifunctional N-acetylglucosamine-1-phosphate uridyltransferase/glucosamine-1-phosphate acetyltransferase, partial [Alphaproteobacteria bacterium CG_4_10_14_0_8_um_filter_53_9]
AQLAQAEEVFQNRTRAYWMAQGVGMVAPQTVWFSHDTVLASGVEIEPNVVFKPGVKVAENATIKAFSHLEGSTIGEGAVIGPFARLRGGTYIGENAEIGSFVVTKKAHIGKNTKAKQLNCLVDCTIGESVNIGGGAMIANYHHFRKEKAETHIKDGASIGSSSTLVAPVTIGEKAFVAAGTVVRQSVEDGSLIVAKPEIVIKPNYGNK